MVRVEEYLNTTKQEVEDKNFNIWLGVSLGNKYFTKEHIWAYIEWALKYTKEGVLVVIPDTLHSVNLEVLDNKSSTAALRKAIKMGDSKYSEIKEIIYKLLPKEQSKIKVARWGDVINTVHYQKNLQIIKNEYVHNADFRYHIRDIVKSGRQDRIGRLGRLAEQELDRLCEYVLGEIPHFINGVQLDNIVYTLIPYPGVTKLDELFIGLQNKTLFPEIAEKLHITNKIAILSAYAS